MKVPSNQLPLPPETPGSPVHMKLYGPTPSAPDVVHVIVFPTTLAKHATCTGPLFNVGGTVPGGVEVGVGALPVPFIIEVTVPKHVAVAVAPCESVTVSVAPYVPLVGTVT